MQSVVYENTYPNIKLETNRQGMDLKELLPRLEEREKLFTSKGPCPLATTSPHPTLLYTQRLSQTDITLFLTYLLPYLCLSQPHSTPPHTHTK